MLGVFVTFGALLFAAGLFTIGDLNDTFDRKLTVSTVFDDVGGLDVGNNVWFSGVKVGTVRRMGFRDGPNVDVTLAIDASVAPFIPGDAQAKVGSDGLIGSKIVVLYGGTNGGPPVHEGSVVAAGDVASTEDMIATLVQNNDNLLSVTSDLRTIAHDLAEGRGSAGKLLADDTLYTELGSTVSSLEAASSSLAAFSGKLNAPGGLANDLVSDTETFAKLTTSARNLEQATSRANGMVDQLDRRLADDDGAIGALLNDAGAGADLKQTLVNLSEGSRLLNEDLEAAQHNFLLRRYFRRQERDQVSAADALRDSTAEADDTADTAPND